MNVGTLTIEMAANVVRIQQDMDRIRQTVDGTMAKVQKAASMAGAALGALGIAMSVDAFARWIKGAINMADQANEMSQKIGVAVKDLGGLQLAFQQGGVDADGMQKALAKLSVGILDGNTALKAMGIATRNADGSLMSTRDVIAQVADQFAGYQDGVAKTALAVELFGRSGADLIPVLNGGSAAFAEFDDWAKRLGITLSEETAQAADKFNDTLELLQMGSQGIAMGIAAGLLPTLQSLAGEFLTIMSDGQNLQVVIDLLAGSLKVLATGAIATLATFRSLSEFGQSVSAKIAAVMNGDMEAAKRIGEGFERANTEIWSKAGDSIDRIWNQTGNSAVAAMASMAAASKKAAPEIGKASEEAAKAAKKQRDEYEKAVKAADDLVDAIRFETDAQKMSNVEKEIAVNLRKLEQTGLQQNTEEYRAYADAIRQATIENEGIKERIKLEKEAADKRKKIEEDWAREVEQINFQIGQSLTDALINGGQTAKEFLINMFKTLILRPILQPIITGGTAAVTSMLGMTASGSASAATGSLAQASALGSIATMANTVKLMSLAALDSVAASAQAATFAVGNALADMGFETLGTAIFESAGTMGLLAQGSAGIGAGLMLGSLISGDKAAIGDSQWYATGGGTAIGAAIGTAILPGIGTAIGGALGGIVGGIVNAGWGSGEQTYGPIGVRGTMVPFGLAESTSFKKWSSSGGWFGGGGSGENSFATDPALYSLLDTSVKTVSSSILSFTGILGLNAAAIDDYVFRFDEQLGNTTEEQQAKLQQIIDRFTEGMASLALGTNEYSKSGESSYATLQRLATNLVTVNTTFDTLGLKLQETSLAGADAASAFIDMIGGIEAFNQAADFYYQNYYTEAERTAKTTESLTEIFKAMNLELPTTKTAFREMVESARAAGNDVLLANLLKLAPAFASISMAAEVVAENVSTAAQRMSAQVRLYQTTGDTNTAKYLTRAQELAGADDAMRALLTSIYAAEDAADAAAAALAQKAAIEQAAYEQSRLAWEGQVNALQTAISAQQEYVASLQAMANAAKSYGRSLRQYADSLIGGGAGNLSPEAQLQAAEDRFLALLTTISNSSDPEATQYALDNFQQAGDAFIQASQAMYGSAAQTDAAIAMVYGAADSLANAFGVTAQTEVDPLLKLIADNTGLGGPLAKQVPLNTVFADLAKTLSDKFDGIFGTGTSSYLYRMIQAVNNVHSATLTLAALNQQLVELQGAAPAAPVTGGGAGGVNGGGTVTAPEGTVANRGAINSFLGNMSNIQSMSAWESSYGSDWNKVFNWNTGSTTDKIKNYYLRFMGRQAESSGLNYWVAQANTIGFDAMLANLKKSTSDEIAAGNEVGTLLNATSRAQLVNAIGYNEERYLRLNPDVAAAVQRGTYNTGFEHFLENGINEGRRFAAGGLFDGGMRLVGERGPELEVTGPARYWSFADTQKIVGGIAGQRDDEVTKELLRDMLNELKAIVRQNGYGTQAQLDKLDALESRLAGVERNSRMERISQ